MSSHAAEESPSGLKVDYVLAYKNESQSSGKVKVKVDTYKKHAAAIREHYEALLFAKGLTAWTRHHDDWTYVLLHCPADRLIQEGERMHLKMPLKNCYVTYNGHGLMAWLCNASNTCLRDRNSSHIESGAHNASAPLEKVYLDLYEGSNNEASFFRPAMRSLLVKHILSETDVGGICSLTRDCIAKADQIRAKRGLSFLLCKGVYDMAFQLPDEYAIAAARRPSGFGGGGLANHGSAAAAVRGERLYAPDEVTRLSCPTRDMQSLLARPFRFRLVQQIRDYYGEEIALYFAWSSTHFQLLAVLMLLGLLLFALGISVPLLDVGRLGVGSFSGMLNSSILNSSLESAAQHGVTTTFHAATARVSTNSTDALAALVNFYQLFLTIIHQGVDNIFTWTFAIIICFWGTVSTEAWKRQCAVLSYMWRVDDCKANEAPRSQFSGRVRENIGDDEDILEDSSFVVMWAKRLVSIIAILFLAGFAYFVSVVFGDVRLLISDRVCPGNAERNVECQTYIVLTTIAHVLSTTFLTWIFSKLAGVLTKWENHKTETQYQNALGFKLFVFSAINEYVPLYYVSIFQGNVKIFGYFSVLGVNGDQSGSCGKYATCLPLLSIQLILTTLAKPLPGLLRRAAAWLFTKSKRDGHRKTERRKQAGVDADSGSSSVSLDELLTSERSKTPMEDFVLRKYLHNVMQYGHIMLFGASMPLAPLFLLVMHCLDNWLDLRDILHRRRRPAAQMAQDSGIWQNVMRLTNALGVITSCLLMATMTANPLAQTIEGQLLSAFIFIVVVVVLKFLLSACIPDVPGFVLDARKQEKKLVAKMLGSQRCRCSARESAFIVEGRQPAAACCDGKTETPETGNSRQPTENGGHHGEASRMSADSVAPNAGAATERRRGNCSAPLQQIEGLTTSPKLDSENLVDCQLLNETLHGQRTASEAAPELLKPYAGLQALLQSI